ncbi:MAG: sodium/pantothenate symporter [Calditrichia bacterium]
MDGSQYTLLAIALYTLSIIGLLVFSRRFQKSFESFAVGSRTDSPIFVGLSLAANMTSAATFVINPGLVYLYGLSGFWGYAVAAPLGIFSALIVMSKRFRKIGDEFRVLTIPQWIGERYQSRGLRIFFAFLSLLQITFIVLIAVGITVVLAKVLNVPYQLILGIILIFTLTYIAIGGASIHILTNSLQGVIMITVAVLLLFSGPFFSHIGLGELFQKLSAIDPNLVRPVNPQSILFRDFFEVFVANFIVGIAIICQPHILSKALYLRSERDVNAYLATTVTVASLFFFVLFAGLYARVALTGQVLPPDQSMAAYIQQVFPAPVLAIVSLGILAAGFSTLEGLFLALSTIFSLDFLKQVFRKRFEGATEEANRRVLKVSRIFLVVLAVVVYFLSIEQIENPSLSVAIFAQNGVYGLFVASFWPIFLGIFARKVKTWIPAVAAVTGLIIHFGMYYGKITHYSSNPGVCAAVALLLTAGFVLGATYLTRRS